MAHPIAAVEDHSILALYLSLCIVGILFAYRDRDRIKTYGNLVNWLLAIFIPGVNIFTAIIALIEGGVEFLDWFGNFLAKPVFWRKD